MKKLAIVGSRNYPQMHLVSAFVRRLRPTTAVVSGGARGVDTVAEKTARDRGLEVIVFLADWDRLGRSAGMKRNKDIVDAADGVVAFWDGKSRGTANSIERAKRAGKWLRVYGPDGELLASQG